MARRVHALSGRKGPFVPVNCGAITEQLAESELFGYEAGSFTGATARREGWFEAAQHGTLFLDEIGDLPMGLQVKLLRALQEKEIVRVGSRRPVAIDVRIVAATSVDIEQAILSGRFRRDLYYRLSGGVLKLPPLRERPADIIPLAQQFLLALATRAGRAVPQITEAARSRLLSHNWPGNIRELQNLIQLAFLTRTDGVIDAADLRVLALSNIAPARAAAPGHNAGTRESQSKAETLMDGMRAVLYEMFLHSPDNLFTDLERLIVTEAFTFTHQNQVHSAALLGLSRNVWRTLLKRHGLIMREAETPVSPPEALEGAAFC